MCISCVDTRNDPCGLYTATNMILIGGITAIVAAFAAAYFDSGIFATAALSTTAVIGVVVALTGVAVFAFVADALSRAFSRV